MINPLCKIYEIGISSTGSCPVGQEVFSTRSTDILLLLVFINNYWNNKIKSYICAEWNILQDAFMCII